MPSLVFGSASASGVTVGMGVGTEVGVGGETSCVGAGVGVGGFFSSGGAGASGRDQQEYGQDKGSELEAPTVRHGLGKL